MRQQGFEEAQAVFVAADSSEFVGQVRRFGHHGPAYEVLSVNAAAAALIEVIATGERLDYPLDELMLDPMAETVP